jgi:ribosomal protein S18 acetylase RimI-like enzyme
MDVAVPTGQADHVPTRSIRPRTDADDEAIVALSVEAWAPVFESLRVVLGPTIFERLHPDWREDQARAVSDTLRDEGVSTWVSEVDGAVAGFVSVRLDPRRQVGEIWMIAVRPQFQNVGMGLELTEFATSNIAAAGMKVARIETGGDPGHAPARRVYQKAGYTLLPAAQYYKAL